MPPAQMDLGQLLDAICRLRRAATGDQRFTAYRVAALERALVIMEEKIQSQEQKILLLESQLQLSRSAAGQPVGNGTGLLVDTAESSFRLSVPGQQLEVNLQCKVDTSARQLPVLNPQPSVDSMLMNDDPAATPCSLQSDLLGFDANVNIDTLLDDIKTPVLEPERRSLTPSHHKSGSSVSDYRSVVTTTSNTMSSKNSTWDGKIRWAIESSIFDSPEEELDVASCRPGFFGRATASDLWLFQYGLRYIPAPGEKNGFRTVKIDNLPLDIEMDTLLDQVCGGDIVVARLLNTSNITGCHTGLVTFLQQRQAETFAEYAAKYGVFLGEKRLPVTILNTPTYPMSADMESLILDEGYTRCVVLHNFQAELTGELRSLIMGSACGDDIEAVRPGQNSIIVRFHSIKMAAVAFELIRSRRTFSSCRVDFAPDPCARPARPPMELVAMSLPA